MMPTIASLFTGGGLVECGAIAAGYRPIWGVEFDPSNPKLSTAIADYYEKNFGKHLIRQPVQQVDWTLLETPDVLWSSPVCKQFSAANIDMGEKAEDLSAAVAVKSAISTLLPQTFCLENVRNYQKSKSLQIIREALYQLDYGISEDILNSADYGVPQTRDRLFLRAVRYRFPQSLPPPVTEVDRVGWFDAIADLIPELPPSQFAPWQSERLKHMAPPRATMTIDKCGQPSTGVSVGVTSDRSNGCPHLSRVSLGERQPSTKDPSTLAGNTNTRLPLSPKPYPSGIEMLGEPFLVERSGARSDRPLLVRHADQPAWTIRASIGTDQKGSNRNDAINAVVDGLVVRLTPRALARLQSVPDWYQLPEEMKIAGPLLGNGVSCLMAQMILESVKPILISARNIVTEEPMYATIVEDLSDASLPTTIGRSELHSSILRSNMNYLSITSDTSDRDHNTNDLTLNDVPYGTSFNIEVLPSLMSELEARNAVKQINDNLDSIRQLLIDIDERQGYLALGFENMSQLMKSDLFPNARTTLQKELQAGRIEQKYLGIPVGTITEPCTRPLSKLKTSYYKTALDKATTIASGKSLKAKHFSLAVAEIVRTDPCSQKDGVVQRIKEKVTVLASEQFSAGEVFILTGYTEGDRKYDGCWAIAEAVNNFILQVFTYNGTITVKPDNLTPVNLTQNCEQVRMIAERIKRLRDCELLDRATYSFLEHLGRQTSLIDMEEEILTTIERKYLGS